MSVELIKIYKIYNFIFLETVCLFEIWQKR